MFHNYFFLKRLAHQLHTKLAKRTLSHCFSQAKDELMLGFEHEEYPYYIRVSLDPNLALLQFTGAFARAGKNTVDLFASLVGKKIEKVAVFDFERSFQIQFEEEQSLIFKMHHRRANILLVNGGKVVDIFKKKHVQDHDLNPAMLQKKIPLTYAHFTQCDADPMHMIPALGKEVRQHLEHADFYGLSAEKRWKKFQVLLDQLETSPIYLLPDTGDISLLRSSPESTQDALYAANWLYEARTQRLFIQKEREAALRKVDSQIRQCESYLQKTRQRLDALQQERNPEEIGHLIMAHLHTIQTGLSKVVLNDFYTQKPIVIPLSTKLSPQKNAERYYRKAKNRHLEIAHINQNIAEKEKRRTTLEKQRDEIQAIADPRHLRKYIKSQRLGSVQKEQVLCYHTHECAGWSILVGKNSKANDELTLKVARKNDLWLHAKDVSGSHVVIKEKPGHNYPKEVIEYAASLAAAHSKRKTDTLCPVIYTPKKYVRKSKGMPPGAVIVEKETIVMVAPASS